MHGQWPKRHDDARSPWAHGIAIGITAVIVLAILFPLATSSLQLRLPSHTETPPPRERVTFVTPPPPTVEPPDRAASHAPVREEARPSMPSPVVHAPAVLPALPRRDSTRTSPAAGMPPTLRATGIPLAVDRDHEPVSVIPTAHAGPVLAPDFPLHYRPMTVVGADSARRALAGEVPRLALTRRPSQEQVDAALREQERQQAAAWDAHRPVALSSGAGGLSIPFPLFAAGPSAAQRRRDSVVNADYVERLHRMLVFSRARMDSICHADSLAGKPDACRRLREAARVRTAIPVPPDSALGAR